MKLFVKLFSALAAVIFLAGAVFAENSGMVFDWTPFVVDDYLKQNGKPQKKLLPKVFLPIEIPDLSGFVEEPLTSDLKTLNDSPKVSDQKSVSSRIEITFSQVHSFMLPMDEIYYRDKEGKFSQATRLLPSLLKDPSQNKALETLKLIEPQLNLRFEF